MFCKRCGSQIADTASFCNKCGCKTITPKNHTLKGIPTGFVPNWDVPTQNITPYKEPVPLYSNTNIAPSNKRTTWSVMMLSAFAFIIVVVVIVNIIFKLDIAAQQAVAAQMVEDTRLAEEARKAEEERLAKLAKVAEEKDAVIGTIELWTMYTNNYDNEKANEYCAPNSGGAEKLGNTFANILKHAPIIGGWVGDILEFFDGGVDALAGLQIQINCSESEVSFAEEDKANSVYRYLPDDQIGKIAIVYTEVAITKWGETKKAPLYIILEKIGDKWLILDFSAE